MRQLEGRLSPEGHDHPDHPRPVGTRRLLGEDHLGEVLGGEWLEVEPVRGRIVRRDRLGVAVHHHGLVAHIAQCHGRVHAAVIELDALTYAVRTRAKDDHPIARRKFDLARVLVGAVVIGRRCLELGRARVDRLEHRGYAGATAQPGHLARLATGQRRNLGIGESPLLVAKPASTVQFRQFDATREFVLALDDAPQLVHEPPVDSRAFTHFLHARPAKHDLVQCEEPLRRRHFTAAPKRLVIEC